MPRRQPRKPSIGLNSCSSLHALGDLLDRDAQLLRQIVLRAVVVRQEFMQRRIEEANRRRQAFQLFEDADEVFLLIRQQLGQRRFAVVDVAPPESSRAWRRCDRLRRTCARCGKGRCRVAPNATALAVCSGVSALVRTCRRVTLPHQSISLLEHLIGLAFLGIERFLDQHLDDFRSGGRQLARINFAGRAVDGEEIAFLEDRAIHCHGLGGVIDLQRAGAANANFAHLAGDERRVRTDAAFGGQDAFGGDHAAQIFGRRFVADQQNLFAFGGGFDGALGIQINLAGGRAGTGRQAFGDALGVL